MAFQIKFTAYSSHGPGRKAGVNLEIKLLEGQPQRCSYFFDSGGTGFCGVFHLRISGLRNSDTAGNYFLGESKIFAPGPHGCPFAVKDKVYHLVGNQCSVPILTCQPIGIGHNYKGRGTFFVVNDLNVSMCVHRAFSPLEFRQSVLHRQNRKILCIGPHAADNRTHGLLMPLLLHRTAYPPNHLQPVEWRHCPGGQFSEAVSGLLCAI